MANQEQKGCLGWLLSGLNEGLKREEESLKRGLPMRYERADGTIFIVQRGRIIDGSRHPEKYEVVNFENRETGS